MKLKDLILKYNLSSVCWFTQEELNSSSWNYKIEWWTIKFSWRYDWQNWRSEIKIDDLLSNIKLQKLLLTETYE